MLDPLSVIVSVDMDKILGEYVPSPRSPNSVAKSTLARQRFSRQGLENHKLYRF